MNISDTTGSAANAWAAQATAGALLPGVSGIAAAAMAGAQQLAGMVRSGALQVDPAQLPAAISEIEALRDEANEAHAAARRLAETPPKFGTSPVAQVMSQRLVRVASDERYGGSQAWAYLKYADALQAVIDALSEVKRRYETGEQASADVFRKQGA
ncbi:hypothetical protein [Gandjariella thermophila]|uniref:PE domain-containing protein n=1 Tax=Gandjariella thermophila TaxID=1931992 RepID=A0A4D4J7Q8_9PSEU|nr:hypothetical protein [Gandjariella thermophila]GDY32825.1 hypothetical protein GTS_44580 [Gandjariella thermophila]